MRDVEEPEEWSISRREAANWSMEATLMWDIREQLKRLNENMEEMQDGN